MVVASSPRVAWSLVLPVAVAEVLLLVATANRYGYHRDELYFRVAARHPAWGYDDQPALTPLLGRFSEWAFGGDPRGLRMLSAVAIGLVVVLVALIARELGAGRSGQAVAALATAASGAAMAVGHLLSTTTFDVLLWVTLVYVVARILGGGDERQWLLVGLVAGIGLENKHLILLLVLALACGCLLGRRWELARSPWLWAGAALAVALWLPNLLWQARHGWPQLELAAKIAEEEAAANRVELLPLQFLMVGPLLAPLWLGGLWWLLRRAEARPYRPLGLAYVVLLAIALLTGAKPYYTMGLLLALLGAGGVVAESWLRGRRESEARPRRRDRRVCRRCGTHHAAARAGRARACDAHTRHKRGRDRDDRLAGLHGKRRSGLERTARVRAHHARSSMRATMARRARLHATAARTASRARTRATTPSGGSVARRMAPARSSSSAISVQKRFVATSTAASYPRASTMGSTSTTRNRALRSGRARRRTKRGQTSGHGCDRSTPDSLATARGRNVACRICCLRTENLGTP